MILNAQLNFKILILLRIVIFTLPNSWIIVAKFLIYDNNTTLAFGLSKSLTQYVHEVYASGTVAINREDCHCLLRQHPHAYSSMWEGYMEFIIVVLEMI